MATDETVSCREEDGTVRCEIEGRGEVQMQDGHREVFEEEFGQVASLDSCALMNEAFLQEHRDQDKPSQQQTAFGKALVQSGCPIPVFGRNNE